MNPFMKSTNEELVTKAPSKVTCPMARESAILRRVKSTSASSSMEKQKVSADIMYFLMAPFMRVTSRIPCLMAMGAFDMKPIN